MIYTEPARARRFRDRARIIGKAWNIARRQHPRPADFHRDQSTAGLVSRVAWTDMHGQRRHGLTGWHDVTEIRLANASRRWQHLAHCSCNMCGNPRTWFGAASMQETLADIDAIQQFAEAGITFKSRFRAYS